MTVKVYKPVTDELHTMHHTHLSHLPVHSDTVPSLAPMHSRYCSYMKFCIFLHLVSIFEVCIHTLYSIIYTAMTYSYLQ